MPQIVRASGKLGEQARLADARLADDLQQCRAGVLNLRQGSIDRLELRGATHDRLRDID